VCDGAAAGAAARSGPLGVRWWSPDKAVRVVRCEHPVQVPVDRSGAPTVDCVDMSTTIRVSEQTRDRFARLADATGRPMTQLLDEAADALERRVFFDQFSARYDALRTDSRLWGEIEAERAAESGAVRDHSS
jgi:hypothetical protein